MAVETRTVHFKVDPALRAYMAWCDEEGRQFDLETFDLFASGYRARGAESEAEALAAPAAADRSEG